MPTDEELIEFLDEWVHELKSQEAAEINNSGLEAQLTYLKMTREEAEREYE